MRWTLGLSLATATVACFSASSLDPGMGAAGESGSGGVSGNNTNGSGSGANGGSGGTVGATSGAGGTGGSPGDLPVCIVDDLAGVCVLSLFGEVGFNDNRDAIAGTIARIDEDERLECFGPSNWPYALPRAAREGEPVFDFQYTSWWRFVDDSGHAYLIGIAAPGLDDLGVVAGDRATLSWEVSHYGWDWGEGTVVIAAAGRGRVVFALNEPEALGITTGATVCGRGGSCSGTLWEMIFDHEGVHAVAQPRSSASAGNWTFHNSLAFTHSPDYQEPNEGIPVVPGCEGPRVETFASAVERDPNAR